jgi:hypothetical protein
MAQEKSKAESSAPAASNDGWTTIQEESPSVLLFETLGDTFIGRYIGVEEVKPEGLDSEGKPKEEFSRYTFRAEGNGEAIPDGTLVAINSSWRMNSAMEKVQPGDLTRIQYVKDIPTGRKLNPLKDFRVDVKR